MTKGSAVSKVSRTSDKSPTMQAVDTLRVLASQHGKRFKQQVGRGNTHLKNIRYQNQLAAVHDDFRAKNNGSQQLPDVTYSPIKKVDPNSQQTGSE